MKGKSLPCVNHPISVGYTMNHCSGQMSIQATLRTVAYVWLFYYCVALVKYSTTSANFMSFFVSDFSYRLTDFDHSDTSTSWNIIKVRSLFEYQMGNCKTSALIDFEFSP